MAKVLVTGGAGFIGSHLTEALVEEGNEVLVYDNLCSGFEENIASVRDQIEFVQADLGDEDTLAAAVNGCDTVFHTAANTVVNRSLLEPHWSAGQNIMIPVKLLELCIVHKVRRFIFSSSAAVYGPPKALPVTEGHVPEPSSPYGLEKLAVEHCCRVFAELDDLDTVSLRYFNVFGPRQNSEVTHPGGVTVVVRQLLRTGRSQLMGSGMQTRDMIHVDNVVRANLSAMGSDRRLGGRVYNVSTNTSILVKEMHDRISDLMGVPRDRECIALPDGNVMDSQGDNRRIRAELGFTVGVGLDEGLKNTVEWAQRRYR